MKADLLEPWSLGALYEGACGAFVVTNFWDPGQGEREEEIGVGAVKAARAAGVKHLVWSTLPDAEKLSGGRLKVKHFTMKAHVDPVVRLAGFERHTFVEAPFYFQNAEEHEAGLHDLRLADVGGPARSGRISSCSLPLPRSR